MRRRLIFQIFVTLIVSLLNGSELEELNSQESDILRVISDLTSDSDQIYYYNNKSLSEIDSELKDVQRKIEQEKIEWRRTCKILEENLDQSMDDSRSILPDSLNSIWNSFSGFQSNVNTYLDSHIELEQEHQQRLNKLLKRHAELDEKHKAAQNKVEECKKARNLISSLSLDLSEIISEKSRIILDDGYCKDDDNDNGELLDSEIESIKPFLFDICSRPKDLAEKILCERLEELMGKLERSQAEFAKREIQFAEIIEQQFAIAGKVCDEDLMSVPEKIKGLESALDNIKENWGNLERVWQANDSVIRRAKREIMLTKTNLSNYKSSNRS